jgi:hypothetical protein
MNEPQTASYDTIAIQNIDNEDFVFEYDKSRGNYPYIIPAGQIKRFPRFLAEHAVKHMIDKILNKRDQRTDNTIIRQSLAEQIVISEEVLQQPPKKTEADILKERVDKLNKPSELESVLDKYRKEEKIVTPPPVTETPPVEKEKFEGLEEIDITDKPVEVKPAEVKPVPTRREIYDYATNKMGITIDETTQKKFDKMKVQDLLKELGDPREDLGA